MMISEPTDWIMIIGNFGFPIAITVYLFIRFEKKIIRNMMIKHY